MGKYQHLLGMRVRIQPEDPSVWEIFPTKCHFQVAGVHAGAARGCFSWENIVQDYASFPRWFLPANTSLGNRTEQKAWSTRKQLGFFLPDDQLKVSNPPCLPAAVYGSQWGKDTPNHPLTPHLAAPHPRPSADQCPAPPLRVLPSPGGPAGTTQQHRGRDLAQGGPRSPAGPSAAQRRKIK